MLADAGIDVTRPVEGPATSDNFATGVRDAIFLRDDSGLTKSEQVREELF